MARRLRYALLIALGVVWPNGGWSDSRPQPAGGRPAVRAAAGPQGSLRPPAPGARTVQARGPRA